MPSQNDPKLPSTQELFHQAAELPGEEQRTFLTVACGNNLALRQRVERLLAADSRPNPDWQFPAMEALARRGGAEPPTDYTARSFGPYRVLERIGMGGMGVVYKAVREDNEYRQTVAIKILPGGLDTPDRVERFRHERQILANLVHPNIARLLDGGTTTEGLPYLVLEFVEGRPVDHYVDQKKPSLADKLRLFQRIADAVQFAHRNLVVHCDLKPANILVEPGGTPKLLDFGISQLLEEGRLSRTATAPLMTPEYASPEQVMGKAITTATDVYALGVLLFVLVTGRRPYDTETGSGEPVNVTRAVCEQLLETGGLPEDLANIIAMATRKEPNRRYSSAEQFSADVGHYLENRPVQACADTFRYRTGKYVRRHRVSIAAAALVAASLLVAALLSLASARDARAARVVAERERTRAEDRSRQADLAQATAEQQRLLAEQESGLAHSEQGRAEQRLTDILELANKSLFDVHTSIERLPGATEARRQIVNTTLEYLETLAKDAADDPRLRLALVSAYLRVADVQGSPDKASLGDSAGAAKSLDNAAEWIKPLYEAQPRDPKILAAWIDIASARGDILRTTGRPAEAQKILKAALPNAALLSRIDPNDGREANLHETLVSAYLNENVPEAIVQAKLAVAGFERLVALHPDDAELVMALSATHSEWGTALRETDLAGSLAQLRESARLREGLIKRYPDNSGARRGLMLVYGQIASTLGDAFQPTSFHDVEGARTYYSKAAVIAHQLADADPVDRVAEFDVASVEMRLGALDPAPGTEAESLASLNRARVLFEDLIRSDPQALRYVSGIAITYEYIGARLREAGKFSEALTAYLKALEKSNGTLATNPGYSPAISDALAEEELVAGLMADTGDRAGAIGYANRAIDRAEQVARGSNAARMRMRVAKAWETMAAVRQQLKDWSEARAAALRAATEWQNVTIAGTGDSHDDDIRRMQQIVTEAGSHLK